LGNLYQIIQILEILGAVGPYYLSHTGEIWHEVWTWDILPQAKFGKNRLRGYTLFGKIIPKNSNFGGCAHILKVITVKFGMRVQAWNSLPYTKFCKNCLRGYTSFGQIYTKN